jgi:hypothetical protein
VNELRDKPPMSAEEFYATAAMPKAAFREIVGELHYMEIKELADEKLQLEINSEHQDILAAVKHEIESLSGYCPNSFKFDPKAARGCIQRLFRIVDKSTVGR